jgi:hypothetical protein
VRNLQQRIAALHEKASGLLSGKALRKILTYCILLNRERQNWYNFLVVLLVLVLIRAKAGNNSRDSDGMQVFS